VNFSILSTLHQGVRFTHSETRTSALFATTAFPSQLQALGFSTEAQSSFSLPVLVPAVKAQEYPSFLRTEIMTKRVHC
jgi:hypothetical protein